MGIKAILIKMIGKVPFALRSRIKNTPGLKQLQSGLLKRWMEHESFVATISGGPAKGLRFPVELPQDKLMWLGTWELNFAEMLKSHIKNGYVCYDIGGYKGYYAGVMALSGAKQVFVFEPVPYNANNIKQLIDLNPELPIELHQLAISDTSGESEFKFMPEDTMGKLVQSSFEHDQVPDSICKVHCNSLDDFISAGHSEPDFLKIDVEGAEEMVLKGGTKFINSKKPILFIEIHSKEIGLRCYSFLGEIYANITVLETGEIPGGDEAQICHYICKG